MAKNVVVVGGGIGGLLSAIVLADKGHKVSLVEKSNEPGGLLRSSRNEHGDWFDIGTHIVRDTSNAALDALLFEGMDDSEWSHFDYLHSGNYFAGSLNEISPFIDARKLQSEIYERGLEQLLETKPITENPSHAEAFLTAHYGETFAEEMFIPALEKLFGTSANQLIPHAHHLFSLTRVLVMDAERSAELKADPFFDAKTAYHRRDDAPKTTKSFYPKHGGIGQWAKQLSENAMARGVKILTDSSVETVNHKHSFVTSLRLNEEKEIPCERLIWTIPPAMLIQAAKLPYQGIRPSFRSVSLFHFTFDRPFSTSLYYLQCYDKDMLSFRITLYPNLQQRNTSDETRFQCTVEALGDPANPIDLAVAENTIHQELIQMGVIDKETEILFSSHGRLQIGFPVLTNEFVSQMQEQAELVDQHISNVSLMGKAAGGSFFMHEVLLETFQKLAAL